MQFRFLWFRTEALSMPHLFFHGRLSDLWHLKQAFLWIPSNRCFIISERQIFDLLILLRSAAILLTELNAVSSYTKSQIFTSSSRTATFCRIFSFNAIRVLFLKLEFWFQTARKLIPFFFALTLWIIKTLVGTKQIFSAIFPVCLHVV